MDIEKAKQELQEIKKDNESKAMIIHNNSSNIQIRWSNKDLKEMAEISQRCARENRAIETVLNELERLKEEKATAWEEWNNIDQYCDQEKQKCKAELEKKDSIINEMAEYMAGRNSFTHATVEQIKEYFTKKVEGK